MTDTRVVKEQDASAGGTLHEHRGIHSDYFLAPADPSVSDSVVPLVVVIGWLDTQRQWRQRKAVDKAALTAGMYTRRGCDVLFLQLRVPQHVVPACVRPAVRELLSIVCFLLQSSSPAVSAEGGSSDARPRPLLFHVFSGGCYLFGEMLAMLVGAESEDAEPRDAGENSDQNRRHVLAVAGSLAGLFADSPVMAEDTPRGLAALLAGNLSYRKPTGPVYWLLRASMAVAMTLSHPFVGRHLAAASRLVELLPGTVLELAAHASRIEGVDVAAVAAPLVERLSGVVVFSEDDRVANFRNVRRTILRWQRWPVRQWWRHLNATEGGETERNRRQRDRGTAGTASENPVEVLSRDVSSLGKETETPALPASERQRWEMSVLQIAESSHASHMRVYPHEYEVLLPALPRSPSTLRWRLTLGCTGTLGLACWTRSLRLEFITRCQRFGGRRRLVNNAQADDSKAVGSIRATNGM